jgi:PAS domain-containing protein
VPLLQALIGKPAAAGDNLTFLRLRWLLFSWIVVDVGSHYSVDTAVLVTGGVLIAVFAATQFALYKLPARFLKGLKLYNLVFLLDLNFALLTLILMGHISMHLLIVLFLTIFITALAQRVSLALVISTVIIAIYLGFRLQSKQGFNFENALDLMDLPFIFIMGLHSAVIVGEAQFHTEVGEALETDNQSLAKKLGMTAKELKQRGQILVGAFDAVPAAALVIDNQGLIRVFNQRAEQLFQIRRGGVIDKPVKEVQFLEPMRLILREAGAAEANAGNWFSTPKGGQQYIQVRSGIARDEEGAFENIAVFFALAAAPEPVAEVATVPVEEASWSPKPGETRSGAIQHSLAVEISTPDDPKI